MHVDDRPNSTWCCNPQFKIATRQAGEVLLCISQQDPLIRSGRHIPKKHRDRAIGFLVMEKPSAHYGRVWTQAGEHVLHDTGLQSARELSVTIRMSPEQCVIVVPYCSQPGQEGPFIIRTFSSAAIELTQVQIINRIRFCSESLSPFLLCACRTRFFGVIVFGSCRCPARLHS
jgi:Calpain large subunit, domain III